MNADTDAMGVDVCRCSCSTGNIFFAIKMEKMNMYNGEILIKSQERKKGVEKGYKKMENGNRN